jgi:uncharacterized surface protein with fasciclin (FAS1) repeats
MRASPSAPAGFGLTEERLLADRELLQSILQYHIVPGPPVPVQQVSSVRDLCGSRP